MRMTQAQHTSRDTQTDALADEHAQGLAIRRHTDRCFHTVEEFVPGPHGGYIVQGVLIHQDDVAEVRTLSGTPTCDVPKTKTQSTSKPSPC
jgi:hypothetical protein